MATIRRNLEQQSVSCSGAAGSNLAGLFEQAGEPAAAELAAGGAQSSMVAEGLALTLAASTEVLQQPPAAMTESRQPVSATPSMAAEVPNANADAHAAALQQVMSALKAAQPTSITASPFAASSLPTPAVRGPSQQLEAALSAASQTIAAASPASAQLESQEALWQPPSQQLAPPPPPQQRTPRPLQRTAGDSFLLRTLAAARGRSSTAEVPLAAASVQPSTSMSDAAGVYTRSSSAVTVVVVAQDASAPEAPGGSSLGGPSYEAALAAADAVAHENSTLMHQQEQEQEGQRLQAGSLAAEVAQPDGGGHMPASLSAGYAGGTSSDEHYSHAPAGGQASTANPALPDNMQNGHSAAASLGAVANLASASTVAGSPAPADSTAADSPLPVSAAATGGIAASPSAESPADARSAATGSVAAASPAAASPAAGRSSPATIASPASPGAQPAAACGRQPVSPGLVSASITQEGSLAAAGHSGSGPPSPRSEQWDVLLDELEASTLGHASAETAASPPPGHQLEGQAQDSCSSPAAAEQDAVEWVGVVAGQPVAACTADVSADSLQMQQEAGQLAATSMPSSGGSGDGSSSSGGGSSSSNISGTEPAANSEAMPEGHTVAGQTDALAQRTLPSRLLRRLATHMQHDSVGSVASEDHAAGAADGGQGAEGEGMSASDPLWLPDAVVLQLGAAAEAANLAERLLNQAHVTFQREAASRQADAAAAEAAAAAVEAQLEGLQAEGLDAAGPAGDASR